MAVPNELIVLGVPRVIFRALSGNPAQATTGAPALRRQSAQWHRATFWGLPASSKRMAPQRHCPVWGIRLSLQVVAVVAPILPPVTGDVQRRDQAAKGETQICGDPLFAPQGSSS
jgi:hypothetical protein